MRPVVPCLLLAAVPISAATRPAVPPVRQPAPAKSVALRVTSAAVFKDGHVLVRAEATGVPDRDGFLEIDHIPSPVTGSFTPFVATPGVTLDSVVLNLQPNKMDSRPVANLKELLRVNSGARVRIEKTDGKQLVATLGGETLELQPEAPRGEGNSQFRRAVEGVHLVTDAGHVFLPQTQIRTITFAGPFTRRVPERGDSGRLRIRVSRPGPAPVTVGMVYLQRGIKWIPGYRLEFDGKGSAKVKLQTTVINELADLKDADIQFVIGVPRIFNAAVVDPIGEFAKHTGLSNAFNPNAVGNFGGFGGGGLGGFGGGGGGFGGGGRRFCEPAEEGEEAAEPVEGSHEDLFYLPAQRFSLRDGETMVRSLAEFSIGYQDVYTADIPFVPEVDEDRAKGLTAQQRTELAAQLTEVRAKHQLRLKNSASMPLTTGPASVFREGRLAAHSLILFTPIGGNSLCLQSDAPELQIRSFDDETSRTEELLKEREKEVVWTQLRFSGTVRVENQSAHSVDVEVVRNVPGNIDQAPEGVIQRSDRFEDTGGRTRSDRPWVNRRTGSGRITWSVKLAPGEKRAFGYTWHAYRM